MIVIEFVEHTHFPVYDQDGLLKTVVTPKTGDFFEEMFEAASVLESEGFAVLAQARGAFAVRKVSA